MRTCFKSILGSVVVLLLGQINHAFAQDAHSGPAMNYRVIDERLATGGHFLDDGLDKLVASGVTVVIDLRVERVPQDDALKDLNAVWEPNRQWQNYMDDVLSN